MKNWAENQNWNPTNFYQPSSTDEIINIVKKANFEHKKIRVYGSKHSFTALNNTDDISLNLDNYQGIIKVDGKLVTVKAGTKLYNLTALLSNYNLAMENMGDVDVQSIAGAIGTGTHGTGINFGGISTQVVAIKFINGLGEEIFCSEEENLVLFKCLQLSLGAFGIITEVTLKCVDNYKLKLDKKDEVLADVLLNLDAINITNRNFEFFWLPYTNKVQTKYSNITELTENKDNFFNYLNDVIIENYAFKFFCDITKAFPSTNAAISRLSSKFLSNSTKVKLSKDVYATPRLVKFTEMEYNIPVEAYKDCLKDIVKLVNSKKFDISFPIENRFVQKDDIYLSPSYQRDSAYIACHVYKGKDVLPYFKALEEIFSNYNGRPHWGKLHYKKSDYFKEKYPMFSVYNKQRDLQDPNKVFLSDYVSKLLC